MGKAIVSVIIPFLNASAWLPEAVASVKSQSFRDWELLLIDDGSSPPESAMARAIADGEKIFYFDHRGHENKGVSVSRNLGVHHASGKFLAFLDADDCWMPDKLDQQLQLFERNPGASMICQSSLFWYSWQESAALDRIVEVGVPKDTLYEPPELATRLYPLGEGTPPCPSGIVVTREAFDRVGGFEHSFTGDFQLYEDQGFLVKMYLNETVFVSSACQNKYRKRPGSITESADDPVVYKKARLHFLNWFSAYLAERKQQFPTIQNAISAARSSAAQLP